MWNSYQEYCNFFWSKNMEPLSEEIYNRDYAPKKDESEEVEPMILTPKNKSRPMKPTLQNHIEPIKRSDFVKVDDYFDALEAQRILNKMRRAG